MHVGWWTGTKWEDEEWGGMMEGWGSWGGMMGPDDGRVGDWDGMVGWGLGWDGRMGTGTGWEDEDWGGMDGRKDGMMRTSTGVG